MRFAFLLITSLLIFSCSKQASNNSKHRILISTDIGGTDPDDNQSLAHLLMYSNQFEIEGLISTPSFGPGSKSEIYRMIDLFETDLLKLSTQIKDYPSTDYLRSIVKEGRDTLHPYGGIMTSTEGSNWIIECARKKSDKPLWVLVWGGLEDIAQALYDAPDIADKIRIYWIGGPNKKWSINSYAYIIENFPNIWFIENNASYRGFITKNRLSGKYNRDFYDECIKDAGELGKDFINYYDGIVKMGDTPSLLYLMHGNPDNPTEESWGGQFKQLSHSSRRIFNKPATIKDTVPTYSLIEFNIAGPEIDIPADSACFTLFVDKQYWDGYYLGDGKYSVRYSPKAPAVLNYEIYSSIEGFFNHKGTFVVGNIWPGKYENTDYIIGGNWYSDSEDSELFDGAWQGYKTTSKWRDDVLKDWETRLNILK